MTSMNAVDPLRFKAAHHRQSSHVYQVSQNVVLNAMLASVVESQGLKSGACSFPAVRWWRFCRCISAQTCGYHPTTSRRPALRLQLHRHSLQVVLHRACSPIQICSTDRGLPPCVLTGIGCSGAPSQYINRTIGFHCRHELTARTIFPGADSYHRHVVVGTSTGPRSTSHPKSVCPIRIHACCEYGGR
jgi:hypothetical protein